MTAMTAPQTGTRALAGDLAAAIDPVTFARKTGIESNGWQAGVLRSDASRMLLNCSRQSGKSTVTALIALHRAIYHPGSLVLLFSPSLRQSSELFRVVSRLYNALGETVDPDARTLLRLELTNGSRILTLPASESTVRGYTGCNLAIFDEASRVEDDLYLAVLPMLATVNGRLVALSTLFGKWGWWSDAWHSTQAWRRVEVPVTGWPWIAPEWIAEQRQTMGALWFDQELMCRFIDAQSSAFRSVDIEQATSGEVVQSWTL